MFELASYEQLFYGGIAMMIVAALCFIVFLLIYFLRGAKLRKRLDEEYGDPQHYHHGSERK